MGMRPRSSVWRWLCPVSIHSPLHRFIEERMGSQDTTIDFGPSAPTTHTHLFPPIIHLHPPIAQKCKGTQEFPISAVHACYDCLPVCVCVQAFLRAGKADTMNLVHCLRGFISYCVRKILGDGRKLFMRGENAAKGRRDFFSPLQLCGNCDDF